MYEANRLFNERFSEAMQVVADPNKESLFFCIKKQCKCVCVISITNASQTQSLRQTPMKCSRRKKSNNVTLDVAINQQSLVFPEKPSHLCTQWKGHRSQA